MPVCVRHVICEFWFSYARVYGHDRESVEGSLVMLVVYRRLSV